MSKITIRVPVGESFTYTYGEGAAAVMDQGRGGVRFTGSCSQSNDKGETVQLFAVYEIEGGQIAREEE